MKTLLQGRQLALTGTQMGWIPVCFKTLWLPMLGLLLPSLELREKQLWDGGPCTGLCLLSLKESPWSQQVSEGENSQT